MKHATFKLGDCTITLIGVDADATLEECDLCHDIFGIQQIELIDKQFLCVKCKTYEKNTMPIVRKRIQSPS